MQKIQQIQIQLQQQIHLIHSSVELNIQHALHEAQFQIQQIQLQAAQQILQLNN
jgi:hypothetical protein